MKKPKYKIGERILITSLDKAESLATIQSIVIETTAKNTITTYKCNIGDVNGSQIIGKVMLKLDSKSRVTRKVKPITDQVNLLEPAMEYP